jgi:hypothetical protein
VRCGEVGRSGGGTSPLPLTTESVSRSGVSIFSRFRRGCAPPSASARALAPDAVAATGEGDADAATDDEEAPGKRSSAFRFCGRAAESARLEGSGGGAEEDGAGDCGPATAAAAAAAGAVGGVVVVVIVVVVVVVVDDADDICPAPGAGGVITVVEADAWRLAGGTARDSSSFSLSRSRSLSRSFESRSRVSLSLSAGSEEAGATGGGEVGGTEPRPLLLRRVGEKGAVGDENSEPGNVRAVRK